MSTSVTAEVQGTRTWYEEFYAAVDAMDLTLIDRLCTPDTVVQMANHPADHGRDAVRASLGHFWTMIGGLRHTFKNVIEVGDTSLFEADCEYTRKDGSTVTIPVATVIERRDRLVASQHIYIDLAPLFA